MKIVLSEVKDKILHAPELEDIIYDRKLYVKKMVKRQSIISLE